MYGEQYTAFQAELFPLILMVLTSRILKD